MIASIALTIRIKSDIIVSSAHTSVLLDCVHFLDQCIIVLRVSHDFRVNSSYLISRLLHHQFHSLRCLFHRNSPLKRLILLRKHVITIKMTILELSFELLIRVYQIWNYLQTFNFSFFEISNARNIITVIVSATLRSTILRSFITRDTQRARSIESSSYLVNWVTNKETLIQNCKIFVERTRHYRITLHYHSYFFVTDQLATTQAFRVDTVTSSERDFSIEATSEDLASSISLSELRFRRTYFDSIIVSKLVLSFIESQTIFIIDLANNTSNITMSTSKDTFDLDQSSNSIIDINTSSKSISISSSITMSDWEKIEFIEQQWNAL